MEQENYTGLVRDIRKWDLVALVFNSIIGASIFVLPSNVYGLVKTYSLFALLVCALVIGLIILCFAEVSSRFTKAGGAYHYAREAFNPLIGFEVGWLTWITRLMGFAAVCNLFAICLAYFWPAANSGVWHTVTITGLVTSLTFVNLIGVRESAIVSTIFAIGKLILFLLFIIVGMYYVDPQNFSFAARPSYSSFSAAVLMLVFAFGGFEGAVIVAGEVHDPRRNYPFALLAVVGTVALLYILILIVCIGTLPGLGDSKTPLADASKNFLGSTAAAIISVGALVSIIGSLHAGLLGLTRLPFALAEQGQLPRILMATHRRFHTPYVSILLSSAVILVLALLNSFISALTISAITRLITYAVTCAGLLLLRHRSNIRPAAFTAPAGGIISVVSLMLCVWLLTNSPGREARNTVLAAVLGLLLYISFRPKPAPENPGS